MPAPIVWTDSTDAAANSGTIGAPYRRRQAMTESLYRMRTVNSAAGSRKRFAALAVTLIFTASCTLWSRRVKIAEEFTLRPTEEVVVSGSGLTIQLKGVGHQWYVDQRADSPYAELIVTGGGASARRITLGESITVGDYAIKLVAANPFRDNGGPDCKLIVTRAGRP